MNDAVWQNKKEKLALEAEALERQFDGVRKKLEAVREKLAFMAELEAEASPSLFQSVKSERFLKAPKKSSTSITSAELGAAFKTLMPLADLLDIKPPSLSVALTNASLKLGKFTKREVENAMRSDNPGLKFNNKSLDRLLKGMIDKGSLVPIEKVGLAQRYEYKILAA